MNASAFVSGSQCANSVGSNRLLLWIDASQAQRLLALLAILALSPLLLVIALLIWRVDGAPVFFGHYRVGKDGKLFRCLKFRTMRRDSQRLLSELLANDVALRMEWERDQKLEHDPRITGIGHFLRKTSLDELPQLLNVLKGEMHFVGPRPVTVQELDRYGQIRWQYVSVLPGITGLWQVSGRNNTSYEERIVLDRQYVERRCPSIDLMIMVKTVRVVLRRDGAK